MSDAFEEYKRESPERAHAARMGWEFRRDFTTGPIPQQRPDAPVRKPTGVELIRAERTRMILEEGYAETADDGQGHDLYLQALAYLDYVAARLGNPYATPDQFPVPETWPGRAVDWAPDQTDMTQNLIKAGALIAASLDRLT